MSIVNCMNHVSLIHLVSLERSGTVGGRQPLLCATIIQIAINWKVTLFQSIEFLFEHLVVSIDES